MFFPSSSAGPHVVAQRRSAITFTACVAAPFRLGFLRKPYASASACVPTGSRLSRCAISHSSPRETHRPNSVPPPDCSPCARKVRTARPVTLCPSAPVVPAQLPSGR